MADRSTQDTPDSVTGVAPRQSGAGATAPPITPESQAQDWLTVWHSEMTALAVDREARELWTAGVAQWTGQVAAYWSDLIRQAADGPAGRTRPDAAPRAEAAAAAPDVVARLEDRVAELERRLAERGGGR